MNTLARHIVIDYYESDSLVLDDLRTIEEALLHAAKLTGATVINHTFHKFSPQGVSGVVVIAESHIAIHTWPEHGCALIDVLTCSPSMDVSKAQDYLRLVLKAKRVESKEISRGLVPASPLRIAK